MNSVIRLNSASGAAVKTAAAANTDDDYRYEQTTPAENVMQNFEQVTVMQYLTDSDVTVETLHKYNVVKQMFNASLPSSAIQCGWINWNSEKKQTVRKAHTI